MGTSWIWCKAELKLRVDIHFLGLSELRKIVFVHFCWRVYNIFFIFMEEPLTVSSTDISESRRGLELGNGVNYLYLVAFINMFGRLCSIQIIRSKINARLLSNTLVFQLT